MRHAGRGLAGRPAIGPSPLPAKTTPPYESHEPSNIRIHSYTRIRAVPFSRRTPVVFFVTLWLVDNAELNIVCHEVSCADTCCEMLSTSSESSRSGVTISASAAASVAAAAAAEMDRGRQLGLSSCSGPDAPAETRGIDSAVARVLQGYDWSLVPIASK